jgi:hypothetical protein
VSNGELGNLEKVSHLVVPMMENRSFDHTLGCLMQDGLPEVRRLNGDVGPCSVASNTVNNQSPPSTDELLSAASRAIQQYTLHVSTSELQEKADQLQAAGVLGQQANSQIAVTYLRVGQTFGPG